MARETLKEYLERHLQSHTPAKNAIKPEAFARIPFFEDVFEKDLWPLLVKLGGNDGLAHIELKKIPPGSHIIQKGMFDMMVYWLLDGAAEVKDSVGGQKTVLKRYDTPGHCFGEMAIIDENMRNADVYACKDKGATILEVDWSITAICFELEGRFNQLLLKTVSDKLNDSYTLTRKAYMAMMKLKKDAEKQFKTIQELQKKLEKAGVSHKEGVGDDITRKMDKLTAELDENIKRQ